jgi:short subunit fatty acids transporter
LKKFIARIQQQHLLKIKTSIISAVVINIIPKIGPKFIIESDVSYPIASKLTFMGSLASIPRLEM